MNSVPAVRFAGFTDPWEQRKLGELCEIYSGRDYKHLGQGDIPVYGTGGYMVSVDKALSYEEDAVGIGRKGTIDKPYVLRAPFWTVDTLFYCIPEPEIDLGFLEGLFLNVDWASKDESTGLPSLSKTIIGDVDVLVPEMAEQKVISGTLSHLDDLITLHQRKPLDLAVNAPLQSPFKPRATKKRPTTYHAAGRCFVLVGDEGFEPPTLSV